MGLKEWKEKYYPTPASEVERDDALAHSLTKWEGLQKRVLRKYNLTLGYRCVVDKDTSEEFDTAASSCALCNHHLEKNCETCPLAQIRGGVSCDIQRPGERRSPWGKFLHTGNARPMLEWLQRAMEKEEAYHPPEE